MPRGARFARENVVSFRKLLVARLRQWTRVYLFQRIPVAIAAGRVTTIRQEYGFLTLLSCSLTVSFKGQLGYSTNERKSVIFQ